MIRWIVLVSLFSLFTCDYKPLFCWFFFIWDDLFSCFLIPKKAENILSYYIIYLYYFLSFFKLLYNNLSLHLLHGFSFSFFYMLLVFGFYAIISFLKLTWNRHSNLNQYNIRLSSNFVGKLTFFYYITDLPVWIWLQIVGSVGEIYKLYL